VLAAACEKLTSLEAKNEHYDQQLRGAKEELERAKAEFDRETELMKSTELRIGNDCMKIEETLECEGGDLQTARDELEQCRQESLKVAQRIAELNDEVRSCKEELREKRRRNQERTMELDQAQDPQDKASTPLA
jgi:chromosome segregation ATPase